MSTKIGIVQMRCTSDKIFNFKQASEYILKAKVSGAKLHEDDDKIENTHIVINSEGEIVGKYVKVHLFDANIETAFKVNEHAEVRRVALNESKVARPGNDVPIVIRNTPVGNLGLAICYDMRFPELASNLRYAQGAHVLTYPSAFTQLTGQLDHWHVLLRARAIENQCYVIAAAQEGQHNAKRSSYGHSIVIDPWGRILTEQLNSGPGLLLCEIGPFEMDNLTPIGKVRQSMPVEYHRRFDLFPMSDSGYRRPIGTTNYSFGPILIKADCVFYRSELSFAFVNISPLVPGHVLVCPIKCTPRFHDLNQAEIADLYMTVKQITPSLVHHFTATSLTISIQDGIDAGQSVSHVHVHVLPRKPNDFVKNDDIYDALQNHDKVSDRVYRSEEVMIDEATVLRQIYYPTPL